MYLESLQDCRLSIGSYPTFHYDARGGGGEAYLINEENDNLQGLRFSPNSFCIPPINWRTTKVLGLSIPPGLQVKMCLENLQGTIERSTGEIRLDFESRFIFTIFPYFRFPDLIVKTCLSSGTAKSHLHLVEGKTLQQDGSATLVGIALVPLTGHKLLDLFLNLPNEALAILKCKIK